MLIFEKSHEKLTTMLIFEKSHEKLKKNLGKTYDHCKAVLGNCEIDYTVVFYVNRDDIFYYL